MAENKVEEDTEKKSSKMMVIIIALVVLLAGGGGAYYFMFMGDDATTEEGEEPAKEEAVVEEEEPTELDTEPTYFAMPKPFIVDFPKTTGIRLLQVSVAFLSTGADSSEVLRKNEPMIRNNLLMLIRGQDPSALKTIAGKEALQEAMLEEVGHIMKKMGGKNRMQAVFFTSFVMQ